MTTFAKLKIKLFKLRNILIYILYQVFFKSVAFKIDPEKTHDRILRLGKFLGSHQLTKKTIALLFSYHNPLLEQEILGIHFPNPVGLSAGFDKNGEIVDIISSVGFGFAEIGSITGEPCPGNKKPRLWRLKKSKGLIVNYGLKNDGAVVIAKRLQGKKFDIPLGISIAKTNSPETVEIEKGIKDYLKVCQHFIEIGDYWTINISCPNSFGGQPFTDPTSLDKLLTEIDKFNFQKPIFLKLSPDLSEQQIDEIIHITMKHNISGFVCTNLTKNRKQIIEKNIPQEGGISGKPVAGLSDNMIAYIYRKTQGRYPIIGVGGIFSAQDAYRKIKLGASLVQLITGMIFQGPQLISSINMGLVELLEKDGFNSIKEAIGADLNSN